MTPSLVALAARFPMARVLGALAFTQLVGWGTTYYLPALLAVPMAAASGIPLDWVFGGVTVMSLVSAGVAPIVGRRLDRYGAGYWMTIGSVVMAAGLLILAFAGNPAIFVFAWVVMGVAAPMALSQSASTAIVQAAPSGGARRGLTVLLLFTGLASTASWPVLIWLDGWLGWRGSILVYAAVHLFVCAPLHAVALARRPTPSKPAGSAAEPLIVEPPPAPIPGGFLLAAISFSMAGFISYGLPLHVIGVLEDHGHSRSAAVAIGTLLGPGQLLARLLDMFGGHRIDILTVGLAACLIMPVALLVVLLDGESAWAAMVFTMGYGISAGLMSIVRAVAPLRLFGRAAYAFMLGRLAVPQNIAFAFSPLVLAGVRSQGGSNALLWAVMAAALISLGALVLLRQRAGAFEPASISAAT
jgi:predicted MFS family arabinose efflux permease